METHASWKFYNADGSEAEMCGNAARCALRYLSEKYFEHDSPISLETLSGVVQGRMLEDAPGMVELALLNKGDEPFNYEHKVIKTEHHTFEAYVINTGVPHAVIEVKDIFSYPIVQVGRELQHHPAFGNAGTNVTFFQRLIGQRIRATTFERGVSKETMACGTGVVAAAIVFVEVYHMQFPIEVVVPGGEMTVGLSPVSKWVLLQGPANYVYNIEVGEIPSNFETPYLFSENKRGR